MEITYFEETQHFQLGIVVLIALIALLFGVMFLVQVIFKIKIGTRPAPSWLLLVIFLLVAAFTVFMGLQKLQLKITSKAIYYSLGAFAPLQSIPTDQIASINLRKYNGMDEFSGWGEKSNAKEDSYTTSGDEGIEIKFKKSDQKNILIGTHSPQQVQQVLSKYFSGLAD
jgi:predicted membrane metal-binding protein